MGVLVSCSVQNSIQLLLRRSIHCSQHFYTFTPLSHNVSSSNCSVKETPNPFKLALPSTKCDLVSNQANSYLFSLLQYNLSWRFFTPPEWLSAHLHSFATESNDFAFIPHSQLFMTICDARGGSVSSFDSEFFVYLLFLHDFSASNSVGCTGSSASASGAFIKIDSFFTSPFAFTASSLQKATEERQSGVIPQEVQISDLFKSCFFYTIYNSICTELPLNPSEVRRFLTSDSCGKGVVSMELSPFLRVLPVLSESERQAIDTTIVQAIDRLHCWMFEEWLVVPCDAFPTFIRLDLVHTGKRQSSVGELSGRHVVFQPGVFAVGVFVVTAVLAAESVSESPLFQGVSPPDVLLSARAGPAAARASARASPRDVSGPSLLDEQSQVSEDLRDAASPVAGGLSTDYCESGGQRGDNDCGTAHGSGSGGVAAGASLEPEDGVRTLLRPQHSAVGEANQGDLELHAGWRWVRTET